MTYNSLSPPCEVADIVTHLISVSPTQLADAVDPRQSCQERKSEGALGGGRCIPLMSYC